MLIGEGSTALGVSVKRYWLSVELCKLNRNIVVVPNINAICVDRIVIVDAMVHVSHGNCHIGGYLLLDAGIVFIYFVLLEMGVKNLANVRHSPKWASAKGVTREMQVLRRTDIPRAPARPSAWHGPLPCVCPWLA